jgi:hypothetical protein
MTFERLAELRDKSWHGYSVLADEAAEVFAHYGEPLPDKRVRCHACDGEGTRLHKRPLWGPYADERLPCDACEGNGFVPLVGEVVREPFGSSE